VIPYGRDYPDADAWLDDEGVVHHAAPAVDTDSANAPTRRRTLQSQLLTVSGLSELPPARPLIRGLVNRGTLVQLSGAPGTYKSFLSVGMACSVAAGVSFEGHDVPEPGTVVYVAAEGAAGLLVRINAWCEVNGLRPDDLDGRLYVLPVPVQLGNRIDVAEALSIAIEVGAALLVIDTRARCTLGLEENSATEQGPAIEACELLVRETGCAVLVIHHAARNGSAGRGSNAWDGAINSDLRLTGEHLQATVTCHKHKDDPSGCEHPFRMVPHTVSAELMPDVEEERRRTLVVVQGFDRMTVPDDPKSTVAVAEIVRTCAGPDGLTGAQIAQLAAERDIKRSQVYASINKLFNRGALINLGTDKRPRYVPVTRTGETSGDDLQ
jgi:hypothetical protein